MALLKIRPFPITHSAPVPFRGHVVIKVAGPYSKLEDLNQEMTGLMRIKNKKEKKA